MSERPFVHLHCHTHYSLLDGASRIPELVQDPHGRQYVYAAAAEPVDEDHPSVAAPRHKPRGHRTELAGHAYAGERQPQGAVRIAGVEPRLDAGPQPHRETPLDRRHAPGDGRGRGRLGAKGGVAAQTLPPTAGLDARGGRRGQPQWFGVRAL